MAVWLITAVDARGTRFRFRHKFMPGGTKFALDWHVIHRVLVQFLVFSTRTRITRCTRVHMLAAGNAKFALNGGGRVLALVAAVGARGAQFVSSREFVSSRAEFALRTRQVVPLLVFA